MFLMLNIKTIKSKKYKKNENMGEGDYNRKHFYFHFEIWLDLIKAGKQNVEVITALR